MELAEARDRSIPVIPRAEMLAELMRLKYGIAVAGAHGKTTTTSMVAAILTCGHLDPTVVIADGSTYGEEATPSSARAISWWPRPTRATAPSSHCSPTIAVVTNVDREHLNHYGDMSRIRDTFVDFINKIPFYGRGDPLPGQRRDPGDHSPGSGSDTSPTA